MTAPRLPRRLRPPPRRALLACGLALTVAAGGCVNGTSDPAKGGTDVASGSATTAATSSAGPAADLVLETFDGDTASLADYAGEPVVVNFWASWCPPCIAEMPEFETVHQALGEQVAFVGINTQDTAASADELAVETGVTYDLLRDQDSAAYDAFGVRAMPTTYFLDDSGAVVGEHVGALTAPALRAQIATTLGVDPAA